MLAEFRDESLHLHLATGEMDGDPHHRVVGIGVGAFGRSDVAVGSDAGVSSDVRMVPDGGEPSPAAPRRSHHAAVVFVAKTSSRMGNSCALSSSKYNRCGKRLIRSGRPIVS